VRQRVGRQGPVEQQAAARPGVQAAASSCPAASMGDEHADHGHDVHFESADAGASLTYPQQAGTVRKNGFLVIKGRPCKVRPLVAPADRSPSLCGRVAGARLRICTPCCDAAAPARGVRWRCAHCYKSRLLSARAVLDCGSCMLQVADVSTSKTGKHGHAKCHFVAIDIFTGKKYEDLTPSSHNCDVSCRRLQAGLPAAFPCASPSCELTQCQCCADPARHPPGVHAAGHQRGWLCERPAWRWETRAVACHSPFVAQRRWAAAACSGSMKRLHCELSAVPSIRS